MKIEVKRQTAKAKVSSPGLVKIIRRASRIVKPTLEIPTLEIVVVSSREIKYWNNRYRRQNKPTDVLSFATGQILIAWEVARRQAKQFKHTVNKELCLLAVHGWLHINGYDHKTSQDRREMAGLEEKILGFSGLISRVS